MPRLGCAAGRTAKLALVFGLWIGALTVLRAEFTAADFLQAAGTELRAEHGKGRVVTLRGTNLGGWFLLEPWMCPTGRGRVRRDHWKATAAACAQPALLDGDASTRVAVNTGGLVVEFGSPASFDRIALVGAEFAAAQDWQVSALNLGGTWQRCVVDRVESSHGEVLLVLVNGSTSRAVRVSRRSPGDWMVGEFHLDQSDDYTVRTTLLDRFGPETADRLLGVYQQAWITGSDLDEIVRCGLNVVRVPLDWLDFMTEDGAWKSSGWERLDWLLQECDRRRLYVILDLHGVPGGASPWASSGRAGDDGHGRNPYGFWTDPGCQQRTERLWTRLAERCRGRAVVAGYDLINEPLCAYDESAQGAEPYSADVELKSAMLDRLYRAVRRVDPDHLVIIAAFYGAPAVSAGSRESSVFDGVLPPSRFGWTNVMYETHHYDMEHAGDPTAQERLVATALRDIDKYRGEWKVPIYAGEYTFYDVMPAWTTWMTAMNDRHAAWTNWTYKVRAGANEPGGGNWGFFHGNASPPPDVIHDSADAIADAWRRVETRSFSRNEPFIALVRRFTRDDGR